jgi:uncharacterized membrane protein HdeD (DUF308 family)
MLLNPFQRKKWITASATLRLGEPLLRGRLSQIWWVVLLRALAAVVFGILTLAWPRHTAFVLVALFGAYVLFDGFAALVICARSDGLRSRWWLTLASATSLAAGFFAFARPRLMALVLISIMGLWLIVRGLTELIGRAPVRTSGQPRPQSRRHWSAFVNGAMSALFGVGLIAAPRIGGLGLMWAIGAWAILHGALMVLFALALRRDAGDPDSPEPHPLPPACTGAGRSEGP